MPATTHMHMKPTSLPASSLFLASFLFLLRDIVRMIHITYIAHLVQNLVKHSWIISLIITIMHVKILRPVLQRRNVVINP